MVLIGRVDADEDGRKRKGSEEIRFNNNGPTEYILIAKQLLTVALSV